MLFIFFFFILPRYSTTNVAITTTIEATTIIPNTDGELIEQEFEKALFSLTRPILDVSLLTSAPQAALLLNSMSVIGASTIDASLENDKTRGAIHLLKTPRSFRASMYQVAQAISDAFQTSHQAMLAIQINLNDVPQIMTSMITAYANPEDSGSKFLMNLQMKNFVDIVKMCTDESTKAAEAFNNTLELIRELAHTTTATAGDNEESVGAAKKLLKEFDEQKKFLDSEKARLLAELEKQREAVERARQRHSQTISDIANRGFWSSFGNFVGDLFGGDSSGRDRSVIDSTAAVYMKEREILQVMHEQDSANRLALAEIARKIIKSNTELLTFEEIVYYLSRGVRILGQIQEQWTRLQNFFVAMRTVVVGPITRDLQTFDSLVQSENIKGSGLLRNQIVITGFKSASLCISVARTASIYNEVSKEFTLPLVDSSVTKLTITKEEAQTQLENLSEKMQIVTDESHYFIDMKLQESGHKARDQIVRCRDELKKALGQHRNYTS